jgi:hypothetical protein
MPDVIKTRAEFRALYAECLESAIKAKPDDYSVRSLEQLGLITDRMINALDAGTANITGSAAFGRLARRLGIKHTNRDISAFWHALPRDSDAVRP